jgi:hypothetical protein
MRGASYGLLVIGAIVAIVGLVNHYVLKLNPVAHTSTILIGVGAVLFIIGLAMTFLGGKSAS